MAKCYDCQVTESDLGREICTLIPIDIFHFYKTHFLSIYFEQKEIQRVNQMHLKSNGTQNQITIVVLEVIIFLKKI